MKDGLEVGLADARRDPDSLLAAPSTMHDIWTMRSPVRTVSISIPIPGALAGNHVRRNAVTANPPAAFAVFARPYLGPWVWNMSMREADSAYDLLVAGWNFGLTPSSVPLQIRHDAQRWPLLQSMIRRKHSKFGEHRWHIEDHTVGRDGGGNWRVVVEVEPQLAVYQSLN